MLLYCLVVKILIMKYKTLDVKSHAWNECEW